MGKKIILSLLSEQPLPNVLFIMAVGNDADALWFLETERTLERKVRQRVESAAGIKKPGRSIQVQPERLQFDLPSDLQLSKDDTLLINLTGGTKPMAISILQYFDAWPNVHFYYIPLGGATAIGSKGEPPIVLPQLTLEQYFAAHGYKISHNPPPAGRDIPKAEGLYQEVLQKGAGKVQGIKLAQNHEDASDRTFYLGGWWEIYIYHKLKKELSLQDDHIALGVKMQHISHSQGKSNNYEVDVAVLLNNVLYTIEGKVYTAASGLTGKVNDCFFKLHSISNTLGLHSRGVLAVLADFQTKESKENAKVMSELTRIHSFVTLADFKTKKPFSKLFKIK